MNLREINKKKYENALKAYQEQIVQIAILEYELRDLGKRRPNTPQKAFDNLKARIEREYQDLAVLAQAVTDTFNVFQNTEEIVAEKVKIDSLEKETFNENYYEILDRYEDQLEHIRHLRDELLKLDGEDAIKAKQKEIDEAYDALAILAAALNEEVEEEITLEDIKKEIDEVISSVKADEVLSTEDKKIISDLEVEEIKRLREETEKLQKDLKANIQRKGELIRKDNAKEENLRGFDEAIRQIQEKIKSNQEELKYYLSKHPELKEDKKKEELPKKGLGFDELSRYIEGYLFMKSAGQEKVHTEVINPYPDQRNISITLNLDSNYTYHYNDAKNPENGESYGYICWIAHRKDNRHITPEEFAEGANSWADECDHIFQFRGDRRAGIQVQELTLQEDGNLHPLYVYETRKNKLVKGVVGEKKLREVSVATMLIDIDEKLNSCIREEKTIVNEEFEFDKAEIERLEKVNKELILRRNENEKRKLLDRENLNGFDNTIRQINEEIIINEGIIASIKSKYPEVYQIEEQKVEENEVEEKPTQEEIQEAIEEAMKNVEASKTEMTEELTEEEKLENEIIGILSREEIADIIDRKLNEIYTADNLITPEEVEEVVGEKMEEVVVEKKQPTLITPEEVSDVVEEAMRNIEANNRSEYEEIFEGTFIIDGALSVEEQRNKVFNLMEQAGIRLTDEEKSSLIISYEGVEDDNGISETQTTKFVVRRPVSKTPYKEPTREDYNFKEENKVENKQPVVEPKEEDEEKTYIQTMTPNGVQLVEKITLYVDIDNSEVYGKNYLFKRFNMNKLSDKVIIDGFSCYKMANDYVEYIIRNQNNSYSPYVVETREVHMGKKEVKEEIPEETKELANEMSIAEYYMLILHPEYRDINKLDKDAQRALFIDYWYIRDNYKDIDNVFRKMKNYYSGADIDDKSLLISILPKYVIEQEMTRRQERNEKFIEEKEYKDAVYKALANKDRYMPEWSYTETMLSEITSVNTKNVILDQNTGEINKEFKVEKPEIKKPEPHHINMYHHEIAPLNELRNIINNILVNYLKGIYTVDEAINELAKVFQQNTNAINFSLEEVETKEEVRKALMNIINNRNALYEMCGILVGELTENAQIQYLNLEDAFKITDLEGEVYEDLVAYLMSTLLIQQTESQIIVDNKVVEHIDLNQKAR